MATSKKNPPHAAAMAAACDLEEQARNAQLNVDAAMAHLDHLRQRNQSGDPTVSGLDLLTATGDVEAAEGLAQHAAAVHAEARAEAAALLALHTAEQVRATVSDFDVDELQRSATSAVAETLAELEDALARRDAASDEAGQALADAGIPPGVWVNGIRYLPAGAWESGPVLPGQYNVEIASEDGTTRWLSGAGSARNTRRTLTKVVDSVLEAARATAPVERRRSRSGV